MEVKIEASWKAVLKEEFEKDYFRNLTAFVRKEYEENRVYPPGRQIFAAFEHSPFDKVKVVILGQDPYHGVGQANGLCFSVSDGISFPPSLQNIFKELNSDTGVAVPSSGNLERWAEQGVLLLNTILTVRESQPGSHQNKGWEFFTDAVIKKLSDQKQKLIFILWGAYAQRKGAVIDRSKHYVIQSPHPSPLSAHRGFFGSRPFTKTNDILKSLGKEEIRW
ncbi:MAG: uracil-DNA glycosylase [Weeksellaceae bacterium]|nr:uracil-DNA glycosylase [Weeksellaceae bacterium]